MKKIFKNCALFFVITALLVAAVGCNLDGGSNKNKIIAIEDIVFGEDGVTVKYEDGYEIFLSEKSLLQDPFSFGVSTGSLTMGGGFGKVEFSTMEIVTGSKNEEKDNNGESQKDDFYDEKSDEKEDGYEGVVEYVTVIGGIEFSSFFAGGSFESSTFEGGSGNLIYGTIISGSLGVRIMGTGNSVVIGTVDGTDSSGSMSFVGSSSVSMLGTSSTMEINGKQYESYDNVAEFAEYFATRLTEATIPAQKPGVEGETIEIRSILAEGFKNMRELTTVSIPDSITNVGNAAFEGCTALTDIFFDGTVAQWNAIQKGTDWDKDTGEYTVHCTDGELLKGESALPEEEGDPTDSDGTIGDSPEDAEEKR